MLELQHLMCFIHCTMEAILSDVYTLRIIVAIMTISLVYKLVRRFSQTKKHLPPGPYSLPLIGYVSVLGPNIWIKFMELGNSYGPVFSFYLGSKLTVILNNHSVIREAFYSQSNIFAGRPYPWTMKLSGVDEELNNGDYTDEWAKKKKFAIYALKKFGYSSLSLEDKIKQETDTLLGIYSQLEGQPIDPRCHLPKMMANLILSIIANKRYAYDDTEFEGILFNIHEWQNKVGAANLLDILPALRFLPFWKPLRELKAVKNDISKIYETFVEEHKTTFKKDVLRDVIDVYLQEYGTEYDSNKIIGLFFSFVGDAVDSLPEAMVWSLLYLTYHPHCQQSIYDEIRKVADKSTTITLSNRKEMPYSEAFIMETLRMCSFVPMSEPHKTLKDTMLNGFYIPAESNVIANLYAAHYDPLVWKNPHQFQPERFLEEVGSGERHLKAYVVKHPSQYLPFSVGKRMCVGDQLSMKVIFLFLTSLLQRFQVSAKSVGGFKLSEDAENGYTRKAQNFRIVLKHRDGAP